ncbi:MAG: hypothetical protein IH944_07610 [Armatimonadetes bacterium]|nr:hypothetical protein [Armatimonadota bacterium]
MSERIRGESAGDVRMLSLLSLRKSTRALWPWLLAGLAVMNWSCGNGQALPEQSESDSNQSVGASTEQRAKDLGEQAKVHTSESVEAGAITPEAAIFIVDGLFDDEYTYNVFASATLQTLSKLDFDFTPIVLALYEHRAKTLSNSDALTATSFRIFRQAIIVARQDLPEHYAVIFIAGPSIDRAYDVLLQHGLSAIVIEEGADRGLAYPVGQESNVWEALDSDPDSSEYILNYLDFRAGFRSTLPGGS